MPQNVEQSPPFFARLTLDNKYTLSKGEFLYLPKSNLHKSYLTDNLFCFNLNMQYHILKHASTYVQCTYTSGE